MKTETKYVCDYCGEKYNTETECQKCEQSHGTPESILESRFTKGFKYPDTISVHMANGHDVIYKFLKPIIQKQNNTTPTTPTESETPAESTGPTENTDNNTSEGGEDS